MISSRHYTTYLDTVSISSCTKSHWCRSSLLTQSFCILMTEFTLHTLKVTQMIYKISAHNFERVHYFFSARVTCCLQHVLQLTWCFFSAINTEEFHLSSFVLNPHPATTFSIMRSQHYAINIDMPYQHPILKNKLLKACWIILTQIFLNALCLQKWILQLAQESWD